jgi:hypothetical protein
MPYTLLRARRKPQRHLELVGEPADTMHEQYFVLE